MVSYAFTDKVFVCISIGFKRPCAKKHSRSDSLLFPILYCFGKRSILVLSHVHYAGKCLLWNQFSCYLCDYHMSGSCTLKISVEVLQFFCSFVRFNGRGTLVILKLITASNGDMPSHWILCGTWNVLKVLRHEKLRMEKIPSSFFKQDLSALN